MNRKGFTRGGHAEEIDWRHFVALPNSGEKNVLRIIVTPEYLDQLKKEVKQSKAKPKPPAQSEVFAQLLPAYCGQQSDFYVPAVWWMLSNDLISPQFGTSVDGVASRVEGQQDWPLKPKERRGQDFVVWVGSTHQGRLFLQFGVCWNKQSGEARIIPYEQSSDGCCTIL